jgi:ATP-binding cassette subfamily C protein
MVRTHWRSVWRNGWLFSVALLFSFCVAVLSLTTPFFMLLVYDRVLSARSMETLYALFILAIGLIVGTAVLDYARRRVLARFAGRVQAELEVLLLRLPTQNTGKGSPHETGVEALDRLRGFVHSGSLLNIIDAFWLPLYIGAVYLMSPTIGGVAIIGLLVAVCIFLLGRFLCSHATAEAKSYQQQASNTVTKIKDASTWLSGSGSTASMTRWLLAQRAISRNASIRASDRTTAVTVTLSMLRSLLVVVVLSIAAGLVINNKLTIGGMVASVVLLNKVFTPFMAFLRSTPSLKEAIVSWRLITQSLAEQHQDRELRKKATLFAGPLLELRDVRVDSPLTEQVLIQDINLKVLQGEVVQILGEPNSGKTMLSEVIVSARAANRGIVLSQGHLLTSLSDSQFSSIFGYVPEIPKFLPGSISKAIAGPGFDIKSSEVERVAAVTGLNARVATLPNGYESVIDALGAPLGKTDRQLMALARALFNDPRLIVIDDPSSYLLKLFSDNKRGIVDAFLAAGGSLIIFSSGDVQFSWATQLFRISDRRLIPSQLENTDERVFLPESETPS